MTRSNEGAVDYDRVAGAYDRRYKLHAYPGIRSTILGALHPLEGRRVLEVGCGTGRWLAELAGAGAAVAGIDPSTEMLRRAAQALSGDLQSGAAEELPWPDASFELVLFVNAFHHLKEPGKALDQAFRVLRAGGKLLSIGLDPAEGHDRWYVYDFFPEALALDRARFASRERRARWLEAAGFTGVAFGVAERLDGTHRVDDALADGLLQRSFTSQLTALSDEAYAAGLQRLRLAAGRDPALRLRVDLRLYATEASKPVSSG